MTGLRVFLWLLIIAAWGLLSAQTIHDAALTGDIAVVRRLVENTPTLLDLPNQAGQTPLYLSARENREEVVAFLLSRKAEADHVATSGYTPLMAALTGGHERIVALLLEAGADPRKTNARTNTNTLMYAAQSGNLALVEKFMKFGIDPKTEDNLGWNALAHAGNAGKWETFRYFRELGLDLGDPVDPANEALIIMVAGGNSQIVEAAIGMGFDPNRADRNGFNAVHSAIWNNRNEVLAYLLDHGAVYQNCPTAWGFQPIHTAAHRNNAIACEMLITRGVSPDEQTPADRSTPLMLAANNGSMALVRSLLDHGATLEAMDHQGSTALHYAIQSGHNEVAYLLIDRGASIGTVTCPGEAGCPSVTSSALNSAIRSNPEMTGYLIGRGVSLKERGDEGWTVYHNAVYTDSLSVWSHLLANKPNLDLLTDYHITPLFLACETGKTDLVRILVTAGADPDIPDSLGETPLHVAARQGYGDIVEILLGAKADSSARDKDGRTPSDAALSRGQDSIVAALVKAGGSKPSVAKPQPVQTQLTETKAGELKVWSLGHSGWAIRSRSYLMIFDFWARGKAPGDPTLNAGWPVPAEWGDIPVLVFVSHEHGDHYDRSIWAWREQHPNITYYLGFRPNQGIRRDIGNNDYTVLSPDSTYIFGDCRISTFDSPVDDGCGFVVTVDGISILHSGDAVNQSLPRDEGFTRSVDKLAGFRDNIALAFLPVEQCGMKNVPALLEGHRYIVDRLAPKIVVPMHAGGAEYKYPILIEALKKICPGVHPLIFDQKGQSLLIRLDEKESGKS